MAEPSKQQEQALKALADATARIKSLEEKVLWLNAKNDEQAHKGTIKLDKPRAFNGTRGSLQGFLTMCNAYILHYKDQFGTEADKVRFVSSRLEGDALTWFEPTLRDYLSQPLAQREERTTKVFEDYHHFESELKGAFGNPEEEREAERKLAGCYQKNSVSNYLAEFRQISAHLGWDDEPLMTFFYKGLKDNVKDEIAKDDRPSKFSDYTTRAVKIDNRLYDRQQEKRGKSGPKLFYKNKANNTSRKNPNQSTTSGYYEGPMELDTTQRKQHDRKCFNCSKPGHYARECRSKKKDGWKPVQEGKRSAGVAQRHAAVGERKPLDKPYEQVLQEHRAEIPETQEEEEEPLGQTHLLRPTIESTEDPEDTPEATSGGAEIRAEDLEGWIEDNTRTPGKEEDDSLTEGRARRILEWIEEEQLARNDDTYLRKIARLVPEAGGEREFAAPGVSRRLAEAEPCNEIRLGDIPSLAPGHENHEYQTEWISCIVDRCNAHYAKKVVNNFFPRRHNKQRINLTYYPDNSMDYYEKVAATDDHAIWRLNETYYPKKYLEQEVPLRECPIHLCRVHGERKCRSYHSMKAKPRYSQGHYQRKTRNQGTQTEAS